MCGSNEEEKKMLIHHLSAMHAHYTGCIFPTQSTGPIISQSEGSYWATDSICLQRIHCICIKHETHTHPQCQDLPNTNYYIMEYKMRIF
jgi:hypothetical protein